MSILHLDTWYLELMGYPLFLLAIKALAAAIATARWAVSLAVIGVLLWLATVFFFPC